MSKPKTERQLPKDAAKAKASAIRTSARKLNLVAASIRGKSAASALVQLKFETRRVSNDVKKVLQSAIANAENNHSLDVDKLYVSEAFVGRSFVMKRFHARGRGKSAGIEKPFSNLTIIVREREDEAKVARKAKSRAKGLSTSKKSTKATAKAATGA
ncbi:MAG: 50S ribosomal protein L22 [Alphaproteobacteria bacterium]|nr:50S ribosomal protein L22 [Alphaproteobacteria bacterium]